eukprot:m.147453 g.147453  ORF g.147453 m.147453 type:complete len:1321 (-) comp16260_c1_seq1:206-4168(-)
MTVQALHKTYNYGQLLDTEHQFLEYKVTKLDNKLFQSHAVKYMAAFFNANVDGSVLFGVNDGGVVQGLSLGSAKKARDSLDRAEQRFQEEAKATLSQPFDPALATIRFRYHPVLKHPEGTNHYVISLTLSFPSSARPDYLIRLDDRQSWCWPLKRGNTLAKLRRKEADALVRERNLRPLADPVKLDDLSNHDSSEEEDSMAATKSTSVAATSTQPGSGKPRSRKRARSKRSKAGRGKDTTTNASGESTLTLKNGDSIATGEALQEPPPMVSLQATDEDNNPLPPLSVERNQAPLPIGALRKTEDVSHDTTDEQQVQPVASLPVLSSMLEQGPPATSVLSDRVASMTGDLVRLRRALEESEAGRLEQCAATKRCQRLVQEEQESSAKLTKQLRDSEALVANLRASKATRDSEVVTLAQALDQAKLQLEAQHTSLEKLQHALQQNDSAKQMLEQHVTELREQQQLDHATLDAQQQQLHQQQRDCQEALEQKSAATVAVHDITARLDRTLRQLEQSEADRNAHQEARGTLQREVERLRDRAELTPAEVESMSNAVEQKEVEIEAMTTVQRTLEERCQALHAHNTQLQQERDGSQHAYDTLQSDLQAARSQLQVTQAELDHSHQQQQQLGLDLSAAVTQAKMAQDQDAKQLQFALAQCHHDVLDLIQALNQMDNIPSPLRVHTNPDTPLQQLQQLRASVEEAKQHVLLRHRNSQGHAHELDEVSQGLQAALKAKQAALEHLQIDLHERSVEVQELHTELDQAHQQQEQTVVDCRKQAQAAQLLLTESEATADDLRTRLQVVESQHASMSTRLHELHDALGGLVYTTRVGDSLLRALALCTEEHQRHVAYVRAIADVEEQFSRASLQLEQTMEACHQQDQTAAKTQMHEQELRLQLDTAAAQLRSTLQHNVELKTALQQATDELSRQRITPMQSHASSPSRAPKTEILLPAGVLSIVEKVQSLAEVLQHRQVAARNVARVCNAVVQRLLQHHNQALQVSQALAQQQASNLTARRRWKAAYCCVSTSRWLQRQPPQATTLSLSETLSNLPFSNHEDAVPGLSVEQQVAWQRLVRLCERTDSLSLNQLGNTASTSTQLRHFRVQPSTSLPTIARQIERLQSHGDELVLALAEADAQQTEKQQDLQRLATAVQGLQAEVKRKESQLLNVQQLLQQQQAELARSVPVEQHQQLEQSCSVLESQQHELKVASQQQELMLMEAERQLEAQRTHTQAELAQSMQEKSSLGDELLKAKAQIDELRQRLDIMEASKEALLTQLQSIDCSPSKPAQRTHASYATINRAQQSYTAPQADGDDLASLMTSALQASLH